MTEQISTPLVQQDNEACWYLQGTIGGDRARSQRLMLNNFPFQVGRKSGLSLTLQSGKVSKVHAEFVYEGSELWLRDLSSTNGTMVNGQRIVGRTRINADDIVQFGELEFRVIQQTDNEMFNTICVLPVPVVSPAMQFRRLMEIGDIVPHYQPVVSLSGGGILGYEVLARSNYDGLETAQDLFLTAARMGQEVALSDLCRREGVRQGKALPNRPTLFVNTHPAEVGQPELLVFLRQLQEQQLPMPLVLEIHESAACDVSTMRELRLGLRELHIGLAYDDFGSGQSRLMELMEVPPDFVKFDMGLVRDIHKAPAQRQTTLETLVRMVRNLGVAPLAEGVECSEEAAVCTQMGFLYSQGFLHGRPVPAAQIVAEFIDEQYGQHSSNGPETPWFDRSHRAPSVTLPDFSMLTPCAGTEFPDHCCRGDSAQGPRPGR